MIDAPLAFAFAAGLVATVNPCGFAMLPAYMSYFLGRDDTDTLARAQTSVPHALGVGATVSAGFLAVFAVTGTLVSLGARVVVDAVPWISLAIGVLLVGLGVVMLAGRHLRLRLPGVHVEVRGRGLRSLFVFGVAYAIASLSCTLPIFLTVVSGTVTRANVASGIVAFVVYALGMSVVLLVLTLALATAKQTLVHRLRSAVPYVQRVSGVLLVLTGGYLAFYWAFNLARDPARAGPSGATRWAEDLARDASEWIDRIGPTRVGIVLGGLVLAAVTYTVVLRILTRHDAPDVDPQHTEDLEARGLTEPRDPQPTRVG